MNRKRLGQTDIAIAEIGLGTWNYHGGAQPLRAGLQAGALFIDTAERSLRRLRTEWIDVYQIHGPNSAVPLEETLVRRLPPSLRRKLT